MESGADIHYDKLWTMVKHPYFILLHHIHLLYLYNLSLPQKQRKNICVKVRLVTLNHIKYHLLVNVSGTTVPFLNAEIRLVDFQTWTILDNTILHTFLMSFWVKKSQGVENKLATPKSIRRASKFVNLEIYQCHLIVDKGNNGS